MTSPGPGPERLRVAIVSTPRSGSTWLRWLLREAYRLKEVAVHHPDEIPSPLPSRLALQLHWHRTGAFTSYLGEHGFRVAVLARHPLDVLVSIVHFVSHEPLTARWLDGEGGVEVLAGANPTSPAFARFAVGPGAAALLEVTREWWRPEAVRVRYEDLAARTAATLHHVCEQLGAAPLLPPHEAIARSSLEAFQAMPNRHGWRATPGLWKRLVVPDLAEAIARAHPASFAGLGYACDPDPTLTAEAALRAWRELAVPAGARDAQHEAPG